MAQDNPHQKQNEAISDEKFLFEKEKRQAENGNHNKKTDGQRKRPF